MTLVQMLQESRKFSAILGSKKNSVEYAVRELITMMPQQSRTKNNRVL